VSIRDPNGLAQLACECHGVIRSSLEEEPSLPPIGFEIDTGR
jgi:hypothetical protein